MMLNASFSSIVKSHDNMVFHRSFIISQVKRRYQNVPDIHYVQNLLKVYIIFIEQRATQLYYIWRQILSSYAIEHSCRTTCGYATIKNVNDHTIEDRMESFFLSETTKYLYLLFDPENFMNNDGTSSRIVETPNGPCVLDAGGYIFNTEAHPLDPAAIYCCSAKRNSDIEKVAKFEDSIDLTDLIDITDPPLKTFQKSLLYESVPLETLELEKNREEHSLRNVRSDVEGEVEETEGYDSNSSHVVSEEETNEQGNLWRTVTAADASFEHSGRSNREGDEKTKKETASEKIKKLLDKARKFDKEISEKSRRKSNFAAELSVALKTLQEKLTAVVDASNHLSSVNMAVRSGGLIDEVSIPVATCKDCCRPLDARFDSLLLKKMMSLIYGRYIYPHRGIQTTNGPICAHNEQPLLEDEYINQWPDVSGVDTRQRLDAVDDIRLSSFRYHSLAEEHYELLSGPPLSYLSQFTGLGQGFHGE
uniref:Aminoacyl-tRNA synthetase class II (D/K/N) domain-containing protein n=1 Tax=Parascaris univalens TaxID=6257 RepID=A0A915BUK3_PARUN